MLKFFQRELRAVESFVLARSAGVLDLDGPLLEVAREGPLTTERRASGQDDALLDAGRVELLDLANAKIVAPALDRRVTLG